MSVIGFASIPAGSSLANGVAVAGSTPSSSKGITVTAPSSANTKAAYTTLVASTSQACTGLLVTITSTNPSANESVLVDIATGAAASETVIMPNLPAGGSAYTSVFHAHQYMIPKAIASGTRISARYQSTRASSFGVIAVHVTLLYADGTIDYGTVETLGVSTGTSLGTDVDPGGTANTKGSWVSLGTTSKAWRKVIITANSEATSAAVNPYSWMIDIATANDGSNIKVPDYSLSRHYATTCVPGASPPLDVQIASGATVYARASCSSNEATIRKLLLAVVGC